MLDLRHRRKLIHAPAVQADGIDFANGEIQRVDMPTTVIQQRPCVAIAGDLAANGVGVQQFQLFITVAFPVLFLLFQSRELFIIHRHKQAAGAVVAINLITFDALADDLAALKHHAAKHTGGVYAVAFFDNVDVAAVGVYKLPAVAPAGAEADA